MKRAVCKRGGFENFLLKLPTFANNFTSSKIQVKCLSLFISNNFSQQVVDMSVQ